MSINGESIEEQARRELDGIKPISHTSGFLKSQAEINSLPKTYTCEIHGEYEPRVGDCIFNGKFAYNSCCLDCVNEFDKKVELKILEIKAKKEEMQLMRAEEKRTEKLKARGVSKRYLGNSFNNYIASTPEKQNALVKCKSLCHSIINEDSAPNLIMVGGVGTGKTHLANSMVIELTDNNKVCARVNMIDMIRRLKSTWSKEAEESEDEVIRLFVDADLLIIDEVGIQFNSDTEKMFIFEIINGRYDECAPTVIISNLGVDGVKEVIGERCIDRLREDGGKVVAFDWSSHR